MKTLGGEPDASIIGHKKHRTWRPGQAKDQILDHFFLAFAAGIIFSFIGILPEVPSKVSLICVCAGIFFDLIGAIRLILLVRATLLPSPLH